jgi:hypothetical protein
MKQSLTRVLRVRALLEDLSRLDLEKKNAEMRQLEAAASGQRRLALVTRADALRMLSEGEVVGRESWLMRIADARILERKEAGLKALVVRGAPAVSQAREEMMARRIDRRQVEALLASAARAEKKEKARREQNRIDDWFQSGSLRGTRKRK